MAIISKQVLSDTETNWNIESDPIPAAGWYGKAGGKHTISFTLSAFIGKIYVLATLENSPEAADLNEGWFAIELKESVFPEGATIIDPDTAVTGSFCNTFAGNYTYIKAGITRDFLTPTPIEEQKLLVGRVQNVLINF